MFPAVSFPVEFLVVGSRGNYLVLNDPALLPPKELCNGGESSFGPMSRVAVTFRSNPYRKVAAVELKQLRIPVLKGVKSYMCD